MELLSVPVIMAIVEALKQTGLDSKYAAIVSLVIGIAAGLTFVGLDLDGFVQGVMAGLAASGLYSGGKKVLQ